ITDAGLMYLRDLRLTELWLGGPKITDTGLAQLGEMSGLTTLGLNHAQVTDAGLVHLERLPVLEKLDLSGTLVTDNGVVCLKKLTGLRRLFLLDSTPITRAGRQELQEALPGLKIDY